jgi:hypothetical protein
MSGTKSLIFTVSAVAVFVLAALAPAGLLAAPQDRQGTNFGTGCVPDRPVIAHHAGGAPADARNNDAAPIPCATRTGYRTGEISIVVTKTGGIIFRPAWDSETPSPPVGAIRSDDHGANWETPNTSFNDTNMWADQQSGRVFWISCGGRCLHPLLDVSDDDGRTWYAGGRPLVGPGPAYLGGTGGYDHVQIFGGPPIASQKNQLKGYPNVVYACMGHKPLKCQKSLDGGMNWGPELDIPYPQEVDSIQGPAHDCSAFGLQGVVDKAGTVYVPYGPCNRPYVAISHDEGSKWQLVAVANMNEIGYGYPSLGMDEQENLYATWVGASDRVLYLAISRDHGMHWGAPINIGAPGVNETAIPNLVAGKTGQVAVAYYASKNAPTPFPPSCFQITPGPRTNTPAPPRPAGTELKCAGYENETWSTYVTETWNALDAQPLFWSSTLNDPAQPIWYGCTPSETGVIRWDENFTDGPGHFGGCNPPRFALDYFGTTMAPDGTVWVGFAQECPVGAPPGNTNCPSVPSGVGELYGLIGRFVPRGEHAMASR